MKPLLLSTAALILMTSHASADEMNDLKMQLKLLNERLSALEVNDKKQSEQTQTLTEELINTQTATSFTTIDMDKTESGLGAAASKVYYSKNPLSIGGYGELFYSHYTKNGANVSEAYRFVPYIGYKFSDSIILNSEIEFEHGGQEIALEQLYIDFLLDPAFNVRLGHQIVPMGLVNLNHEPVLFNTVKRPDVERYLIPSTWHENGLSVYGKTDTFNYAAGVVVALDMGLANHDGEPEAASYGKQWIMDGRRGGNETNNGVSNLAVVARLDYTGINGLMVGASLYTGKAGPSSANKATGQLSIGDIHTQYQYEGFKLKVLYAQAHLSNADSYLGIHTFNDVSVDFLFHPQNARGGYVNMEYNILPLFSQATGRMPVFFQYENYNMATSLANSATSFGTSENFSYGVNYFPHEQVVLKGEYTLRHNKNSVSSVENEGIYSFGLGFIF
ncbi:MAG: porin [Sulfuricurvum sp.]|nr:porin [Sulfuricurvum sp.]